MAKIFLPIFLWSCSFLLEGQNSTFSIDNLSYGNYAIGYQLLETFDLSRTPYKEQERLPKEYQKGRMIPINVWYPAQASGTAKRVNYQDYLNVWGKKTDYRLKGAALATKAKEEFKNYHYFIERLSLIDSVFQLDLSTKAYFNLEAPADKYPLVVIAHGCAWRYFLLAEYLASHGFVVAVNTKLGSKQKRFEMGISGVETQTRDLEFMISELGQMDFVDVGNIASIGFSYGSLAAVELASRDKRVKAVVSLDGVIGYQNEGELHTRLPYYDPSQFSTPIQHIYSNTGIYGKRMWLDQFKHAEQFLYSIADMRHSDFVAEGILNKYGIAFAGVPRGDMERGFSYIAQYILQFLQAFQKNKQQSRSFLMADPVKNGISNSALSFTYYPKKSEPSPDASELLEIMEASGFEQLIEIYEEQKKKIPHPFSILTFYEITQMLYRYKQFEDLKKWTDLFVKTYPLAVLARYYSGATNEILKQPEAARVQLQKALQLLPDDSSLNYNQKIYYQSRIESKLKSLAKG